MFRELFEETGYHLTDRRNMHDLIPFIHKQEFERNLSEFVTSWISLFSHSPKTRFLWLEQTGKSMATYSPTRWWSRWEVMEQVSIQFGYVLPFLQCDDIGSATTTSKLLMFLLIFRKEPCWKWSLLL